MIRRKLSAAQPAALAIAVLVAATASQPACAQIPAPRADDGAVRTTIIPGEAPATQARPVVPVARGDITLNFPGVDVAVAAKAVLGDILGLKFTVDPSVHGVMTLRTGVPVPRGQVMSLFEEALRSAGFALVARGGGYAITPLSAAHGTPVNANDPGFGDEIITLRFANAVELRKVLDPLAPNAISQADPVRNVLVVSGTTVQRKALRDMVAQFDVDWLKGMSFALFVPQHTDSRLIAPELDRLLNATGAPTAGMVRLLSMDRLNGILAISSQAQLLQDVRRWVEVLDREGEGADARLFVYRVQNGRSADLAKVLTSAFGGQAGSPTAPAASGQGQPAASPAQASPPASPEAGARPSPGGTRVNTGGFDAVISSDETNNAVVVYAKPRDYAAAGPAGRRHHGSHPQ